MLFISEVSRKLLTIFNLADIHVRDATPLSLTWTYRTPLDPSRPSSVYSFSLLDTLTHEYPNGRNYPVAAANFFWTFFQAHTLAASVEPQTTVVAEATIYPNPAKSHIVVGGSGPMTITLTTALGQRAFSRSSSYGEQIDLSSLPRGLYIAEITDARHRSTRMVVVE
jgi:hypothetical protein